MKTAQRKSGTRLMNERAALEDEQRHNGVNAKVRYMLQQRDRELRQEEVWDRAHRCPVHHLTLSRTGICALCELSGGPHAKAREVS